MILNLFVYVCLNHKEMNIYAYITWKEIMFSIDIWF